MGEDTNVLRLILLGKKRKVVRIFTRIKDKLMREERNIEKVNNDEFLKWIYTIKQKF